MNNFSYLNILLLTVICTASCYEIKRTGNEIGERIKRDAAFVKHNINYFIETNDFRDNIKPALDKISESTCIEFTEKNDSSISDSDLIFLIEDSHEIESSDYKSTAKKAIMPSSCYEDVNCILRYTLIALGLTQPHRREDRDSYVKVIEKNLNSSDKKYFDKTNSSLVKEYGIGYDFGSITHEKRSYRNKLGRTTIEPHIREYIQIMGKVTKLSFNDKKFLDLNYCYNNCENKKECKNGGYSNPKNCNECLCPSGFIGDDCSQLDYDINRCIYDDKIVEVNNKNKYEFRKLEGNGKCVHKFVSKNGTKILLKMNIVILNEDSCSENSVIEIKHQKDKGATGLKVCGEFMKDNLIKIESENNEVVIIFDRQNEDYIANIGYKLKIPYKKNKF